LVAGSRGPLLVDAETKATQRRAALNSQMPPISFRELTLG
jgi:hypothetical protein